MSRQGANSPDYYLLTTIYSLRLFFHQFNKSLEVVFGVMWTGGRFGMVLYGNDWQRLVAHAFDAFVIEVYVRDFDIRRQRFGVHREAMIVGSDFDVPVAKIFHRLIATAMAEPQLESFAAERASQ